LKVLEIKAEEDQLKKCFSIQSSSLVCKVGGRTAAFIRVSDKLTKYLDNVESILLKSAIIRTKTTISQEIKEAVGSF
jgi:hypothetical protein